MNVKSIHQIKLCLPICNLQNSQKLFWENDFKIDYWPLSAKKPYVSYYVYYFKENVALNQLSKMREHLDKRTEDLGLSADDAEDRQSGNGRRRSSVWEGLAEVWKIIEY